MITKELERKLEDAAVSLYNSLPPSVRDFLYEEGISAHLLSLEIIPAFVRNKEEVYVNLKEGIREVCDASNVSTANRLKAEKYVNKVLDFFYQEL